MVESTAEGICQLARIDAAALSVGPDVAKERGSAATPIGDVEVIVPLADVVDLEEESKRLDHERHKIEQELERVDKKLSNDKFVSRANPEVVEKEREKQSRLQSELEKLIESLNIIGSG